MSPVKSCVIGAVAGVFSVAVGKSMMDSAIGHTTVDCAIPNILIQYVRNGDLPAFKPFEGCAQKFADRVFTDGNVEAVAGQDADGNPTLTLYNKGAPAAGQDAAPEMP